MEPRNQRDSAGRPPARSTDAVPPGPVPARSPRGYDSERLRSLAVSETGFIFDPRTGHSYSVNSTGLMILAAMKEGASLGEIAARLRTEFDAEGVVVEDDVEVFLGLLADHGIAERAKAGKGARP